MFSQTPEGHLVMLQAVFDKLKAAGLKLKTSKCELFKKQINYLGHVVGHKGVGTDPGKIKAVTEWPRPTTMTEARSFLGFVSYYRRFIPNFPKVAKPLNIILQNLEGTSHQKNKFRVHWGPEQKEAFDTLQRLYTEALYWHRQILKLHLSFTLTPVVMDWGQCYTKTRMVNGGL